MRFLLDDEIARQPDECERLFTNADVPRLDLRRPIVFAGLGSSLHAARVAADWLATEAGVRAAALDAHELLYRLPLDARDQLVLVTHRGGGLANRLLAKATAAGARVIAVCGLEAQLELDSVQIARTCSPDRSETHTVSFTCALARLSQLVGRPAIEAATQMRDALARPAPAELARTLAGRAPLVFAGFGLDAIAADEAALKIKEAAHLWAEGSAVESLLHGPISALDARAAVISFSPARDDGGRTEALRRALPATGALDVRAGPGAELDIPPADDFVRPFLTALAVQRLAAELARVRGTNPDVPRVAVPP